MSYTKHNFANGDTIHAAPFNDMEDQIAANEANIANGAAVDAALKTFMTDFKALLNDLAYTTADSHAAAAAADADAVIFAVEAATYTITRTLTHCTVSNSAASVARGASYAATIAAESGYTLGTVTVAMGGTDITSTAYNSSTHAISIASVTGNIAITATAASNTYTVTRTLTHCTVSNSSATAAHGSSYTATVTADSGYTLGTVTVTMGGTDITASAYNSGTGAIAIPTVTGNIVITASATQEITAYTITKNLTHCTLSNSAATATAGSTYSTTIIGDTYYDYIESVTVTMGGTDITSTAYSDHAISIASVTGNIVITVAAGQSIVPPAGTYTVTKHLTHATVSNSAETVEEGTTYTAAVAAESGYTLGTVTVTMGGTDITSTVYNSGTGAISIASVTGDIVITATAAANTYTITKNLSNCALSNTASTAAHGSSYTATVTYESNYDLQGVTVTMGGTNITSTAVSGDAISIASVTGNIVITATAQSSAPVLSSISAVFNGGAIIRATDSLDSLKTYLTVTATYSDSSTETVNASNYTLSGNMTVGTKIITVAYGGKTTTFQVTVHGGLTLDRVTLPSGYTQIEAIISNQRQYVDLNVLSSAVSRAQYGVQLVTESNNYHEHILSSSATFYPYFKVGTSSKTVEAKNAGNVTISSGDKSFDWAKDTDYAVDAAFPDVKVNGTTLYTLPAGTSTNINNLFLCANNDNGTPSRQSSIRVYYLKLYDTQNQLAHNYVPCTNSSNVAGLYDTVAEEFIASSSETAFAAGEVL